MRVSSIPLAAIVLGLPVLCAAFLLPPDLHLTKAVPQSVDPGSIGVSVGCAGCNWHKDAEDMVGVPYQPGLESDLLFDIHTLDDHRILKINNADILPFGPTVPLAALQVPSAATTAPTAYFPPSHSLHNPKLGHDILVTSTLTTPHDPTKEITINLRITSVDGVRNDAIEELQIVVHENTLTQQLKIVSVTKKPLEGFATELTNVGGDTCQGWFEYIIAMFHHKMDNFRGAGTVDCYGGEDKADNMGGSQHINGNNMGQGHCRYHGGSHTSQWLTHPRPNHHRGNFFTRLVRQMLMPILVGIFAGVGAALAGLIVGKGMRKLYQMVAMRWCRGAKSEEHEDESDEEKGFLKEIKAREVVVEGPPAYLEEGTTTTSKE